jgi:hypothetical protein
VKIFPATISHRRVLAVRRIGNTNANVATGDEIRAGGVDLGIPAQELLHGEGVPVAIDDVPAGIADFDSVEEVAYLLI